MTSLPTDIDRKISSQFADAALRQVVRQLILSLWTKKFNVGHDQLARSILTIADGQVSVIKQIMVDYYGDPRDVIMEGERKLGNPKNYFITPFD